jgi:thymidylate synthase
MDKKTGLKEGTLTGFLGDTHIYRNHIKGVREQLKRQPYSPPKIETPNFSSILKWEYTDTKVNGYQSYPKIDFEIAV